MCNQRQASDQAAERTSRAKRATLDDVGVNHGCLYGGRVQGMAGQKMLHIAGRKSDWQSEISNLSGKEMATDGIKDQIARILDKNSFCHIFCSYAPEG